MLLKKIKKESICTLKLKVLEKVIEELEKNEIIDKNLLRYMTVKVKKFDLEAKYFSKKMNTKKKNIKRI